MTPYDAPNYRRSASSANCATCRYFEDSHCSMYDFDANPGFTCDSWVSREETHTPNQASVMKKHSSVTLMGLAEEVALEKVAGTPFLKQDRPEGVKKVYRALKRDHPEMPAEMKARIAARQGKPGKQRQGPPYKGPLTKEAQGHSLAADFLGGIDPFGAWTSDYGQKAERRGESEQSHRMRHAAATAGGLIGGATVVPSAIMGIIGGARGGFGAKKGKLLQAIAQGALEGAKSPVKAVVEGGRATRAIRRAAKAKGTTNLTPVERKALEYTARQAPVGAAEDLGRASGTGDLSQGMQLMGDAQRLSEGKLSPEMAARLAPSVTREYGTGVAQLGLGGGIGGVGAAVQYQKGREAEKEFQKRQARMASIQKNASAMQWLRKWLGGSTETAGEEAMKALRASKKKARYGGAEMYGTEGGPAAPAVQLERMKQQMQKKAFLQASPSGKKVSRQLMHKMLELLLAQYLLYYELHWKYRTHYGDHLVFERLYEKVQEELDALAEKIIGYHGASQLELIELVDGANSFIKRWTAGNEDFLGQALEAERTLQNVFHEYYDLLKAKDLLPMGLDDYIMAVCNDHETHTYLLQQVREGRDKQKVAKVLSAKGRRQIAEGNFALPGRRYPIHDRAHARNALARVAQHGTPGEQAAVRRAVEARFPNIGKEKTAMDPALKRMLQDHADYGAAWEKGLTPEQEKAWEKKLNRSMDRYAYEKGKSGRRATSLRAGAMGALGGGLMGGLHSRRGAAVGATLGALALGGSAAVGQRRGARRHQARMKNSQEKTAMPSKQNILKALGVAGGLTAAGAGGYVAGHRSGMKRDRETPYNARHMQFAYAKGQQDIVRRLRQRLSARQQGQTKKASALALDAFEAELHTILSA